METIVDEIELLFFIIVFELLLECAFVQEAYRKIGKINNKNRFAEFWEKIVSFLCNHLPSKHFFWLNMTGPSQLIIYCYNRRNCSDYREKLLLRLPTFVFPGKSMSLNRIVRCVCECVCLVRFDESHWPIFQQVPVAPVWPLICDTSNVTQVHRHNTHTHTLACGTKLRKKTKRSHFYCITRSKCISPPEFPKVHS